jgi:tetratricopeptide (TPR) repeat protein
MTTRIPGPPNQALGELLARLRWTPYRLAREVNRVMGPGYVHRTTPRKWLAHGVVPFPPLPELVAEILGDALGEEVPCAELWPPRPARPRMPPTIEATPVMAEPVAVAPAEPPRTLEEILDQWDALMLRREFVNSGLATAALAVTPGFPTTPVTTQAMRAHIDLIDVFRRLDNLHGGGAVLDQARNHFHQLMSWRQATNELIQRQRIAFVTARSASFLGWVSCDLGRWAEAGGYYRQAVELAAEAQDLALHCHLLNGMSNVLAECGRHAEALNFADAAVERAGTSVHPAVQWYLRADRAELHAAAGNINECHADRDAAESFLTRIDDGEAPPYAITHDEPGWDLRVGQLLLRLGASTPSLRRQGWLAIDRARETWPVAYARAAAGAYASSAQARVQQGEIEAAASFTRQAFEVASRTGSVRNLRRAQEARAALAPHRRTRAVRDLDDYLLSPGT